MYVFAKTYIYVYSSLHKLLIACHAQDISTVYVSQTSFYVVKMTVATFHVNINLLLKAFDKFGNGDSGKVQ